MHALTNLLLLLENQRKMEMTRRVTAMPSEFIM